MTEQTTKPVIDSFFKEYRFLSNFYLADVRYFGETYPSVEHAYQAAKTLDLNARQPFQDRSMRPGAAKAAGRRLKIRKDWEEVKIEIMTSLVAAKFWMHPELSKKLIETGDAILIEGNNWGDIFWGICKGKGKNHLGQILTMVREDLKQNVLTVTIATTKEEEE